MMLAAPHYDASASTSMPRPASGGLAAQLPPGAWQPAHAAAAGAAEALARQLSLGAASLAFAPSAGAALLAQAAAAGGALGGVPLYAQRSLAPAPDQAWGFAHLGAPAPALPRSLSEGAYVRM